MRGLPNAAITAKAGGLRLAVLAVLPQPPRRAIRRAEKHATSILPWVADLEHVSNIGKGRMHFRPSPGIEERESSTRQSYFRSCVVGSHRL